MRRDLWRLLKFLAPFRGLVILATLLGFATIGSSIGLMATSAYIIAKAALHPSIAALQLAIVGVRFFGIARGVFRYLERYVSHQVTFHLLARLRVWFYTALEPLAPARLMQYHSGDLFSRMIADIETLENFYGRAIAPPLIGLLTASLMWLLIAPFSTGLAVTTLLFLALVGLGLPLLVRRLSQEIGQQLIEVRAELNIAQVDGIQGLADLLIAGREADHQRQIETLSQRVTTLQTRMARITGLHLALSGLLTNWSTLAILLIAIPLVNQGQLDGVYLALLVLAVVASFEAVVPLPEAIQQLGVTLAAARRLFELVEAKPTVRESSTLASSPQDYSLVVQNLGFCYSDGEPLALDDISFTLPEGGRLAIVGPSGAGKSTLVQLLVRFWEYQAGQIQLGGRDVRAYSPDQVRQMMSVVSQQTHLFNGTIRENLLIARPDASEAQLIAAAQQAQLHEFIQGLPGGYDTEIGEQGLRLSGGERQRLAIARALLKNTPILILDEPTAHLDPLVEQELLRTIYTLMAGRTTLLITHRLVSLEAMDEILVLHQGRIVERGCHAELLQAEGLYRHMWNAQHQIGDLAAPVSMSSRRLVDLGVSSSTVLRSAKVHFCTP
jgi:thiol reductant ABC exporter CydC subunit